jgi:Ni,Fe-hydrogenase III component G
MNREELKTKLKEIDGKIAGIEEPTQMRMTLPCEVENSFEVCKFLFEEMGCRFVIITALETDECLEALYQFSYDQLGIVITVKVFIRDKEKPALDSITSIVTAAEWIEREIHDLYGIHVNNHPRLERIILADDWPEGVYPMRKGGDQ